MWSVGVHCVCNVQIIKSTWFAGTPHKKVQRNIFKLSERVSVMCLVIVSNIMGCCLYFLYGLTY